VGRGKRVTSMLQKKQEVTKEGKQAAELREYQCYCQSGSGALDTPTSTLQKKQQFQCFSDVQVLGSRLGWPKGQDEGLASKPLQTKRQKQQLQKKLQCIDGIFHQ